MVNVTGTTVNFLFYRPQAYSAHVVGDFNSWHCSDLPMTRDSRGYWQAKLRLPAGEYRFRYVADGQWFTDYAAFGVRAGPWGMDSVLWVDPSAGRSRRNRNRSSVPA
jgi:1,4-alpha-glucan branching enzyme